MGIHAAMERYVFTPTYRDSLRSLVAHMLVLMRYLEHLGILSEVVFTHVNVGGPKFAGRFAAFVNEYYTLNGDGEKGGISPDDPSLIDKLDEIFKAVNVGGNLRYRGLEVSLFWMGRLFDRLARGYAKVRFFGTPGTKTDGHIEVDVLDGEGLGDTIILGDIIASALDDGVLKYKDVGRFFEEWLHSRFVVRTSDVRNYLGFSRLGKVAISYEDEPFTALSRRYGMGVRSTESLPREVYESLRSSEDLRMMSNEILALYKVMDVVRLNKLRNIISAESREVYMIAKELSIPYVSAGSFIAVDSRPLNDLVLGLAKYYVDRLSQVRVSTGLPGERLESVKIIELIAPVWDTLSAGSADKGKKTK